MFDVLPDFVILSSDCLQNFCISCERCEFVLIFFKPPLYIVDNFANIVDKVCISLDVGK